jgi:CheY-like chemotaxis protein
MKKRALELLVVEDNPGDVVLLTEAVERTGDDVRIHIATDGEEAIEFLGRSGRYADAPRPDVIVLDLNLPIKSGREVLAELRAVPAWNSIPLAVLTTSKTESDCCAGSARGRCRYFVKPGDFKELVEIAQQIVQFARARTG